jgi:glycosyltransferase involved in cell wall biosynthesis
MRVLMITLGYPKYPGEPTAPFIEAIARSLAARGHSLDVVLPYHPEFRYPASDEIRFFPYRYSPVSSFAPWGFGNSFGPNSRINVAAGTLLPAIALSLRRCVRRRLAIGGYDVIHAHWVVPNGWLAASAGRAHKVPLVVTLHGSDVAMAERYRVLGRIARRTFESADAVTTASEDLLRRAQALGADARRSETVRLGVDTDLFSPGHADPALRAQLGAGDGTFLVVSVGRLAEVKGFEYLIAAASQLDRASVAIVGDGELRGELEQRIRSSSAPLMLAGSMQHPQVADAIAASDAVVVPSVVDRSGRVDGLPSTVLEAMACGRPLVATNVGGIPEVVKDEYNGLLVPERNAEALAAAIQRLQGDPALRDRLSRQAREFALERLSWGATAEAFEETYERAINRSQTLRAGTDAS